MADFAYERVSDEDARFMAKQLLADSIWKESNVELAPSDKPITFPDTLSLLEDVTPKGLDIDTVLIVKNLRDAWKKMFELIDSEILTIEFIAELNYQIVAGLFRPAGELRKSNAFIRGTTYTPPIPSDEDINRQLVTLQSLINPLDRAFEAFCLVARDQWFKDGNKRTAQVLMNALLIKNGCGVASVKQEDIPEFFNLLVDYYNSGKSSNMKQFLYEKCFIAAKNLV
jgi:Fic family protein